LGHSVPEIGASTGMCQRSRIFGAGRGSASPSGAEGWEHWPYSPPFGAPRSMFGLSNRRESQLSSDLTGQCTSWSSASSRPESGCGGAVDPVRLDPYVSEAGSGPPRRPSPHEQSPIRSSRSQRDNKLLSGRQTRRPLRPTARNAWHWKRIAKRPRHVVSGTGGTGRGRSRTGSGSSCGPSEPVAHTSLRTCNKRNEACFASTM